MNFPFLFSNFIKKYKKQLINVIKYSSTIGLLILAVIIGWYYKYKKQEKKEYKTSDPMNSQKEDNKTNLVPQQLISPSNILEPSLQESNIPNNTNKIEITRNIPILYKEEKEKFTHKTMLSIDDNNLLLFLLGESSQNQPVLLHYGEALLLQKHLNLKLPENTEITSAYMDNQILIYKLKLST